MSSASQSTVAIRVSAATTISVALTQGGHDQLLFDDGLLTGEPFDDTGLFRVWPASIALCRHLEADPSLVARRRVLELGAGTGLPSLLCAHHIDVDCVLATDANEAAIVKMVEALHSSPRGSAMTLAWDVAGALESLITRERIDTLLLADVVYPSKDSSPLIEALRRALQLQTEPPLRIFCATTCREPVAFRSFDEALRGLPATVSVVAKDASEADPLYGAATVYIYRIDGKAKTPAASATSMSITVASAASAISEVAPVASAPAQLASAAVAAAPPVASAASGSTWRLGAARLRLWPEEPPARVRQYHHGWVHTGNERMLRRLIATRRPRVIVELGSWLGLCTTLLLEETVGGGTHGGGGGQGAAVFAIDRWDPAFLLTAQADQYAADEEALRILHADGLDVPLYETFLVNMWAWRRRLFPLRMDTRAGLETIAAIHAPVDFIYIDADHTNDGCLADLRAARRLFPTAMLCGDDWQWSGVRAAVEHFAADDCGGRVIVRSCANENWWWLDEGNDGGSVAVA